MYGKVLEFVKSNWRTLLYCFAVFGGILCGFWACQKSTPLAFDANRNRIMITIQKSK